MIFFLNQMQKKKHKLKKKGQKGILKNKLISNLIMVEHGASTFIALVLAHSRK
jgi:hypothetical protein